MYPESINTSRIPPIITQNFHFDKCVNSLFPPLSLDRECLDGVRVVGIVKKFTKKVVFFTISFHFVVGSLGLGWEKKEEGVSNEIKQKSSK